MSDADGRPALALVDSLTGCAVSGSGGATSDADAQEEALDELPARVRSKFQKTKYCDFFIKRGRCRKRHRCMFAHSEAELRPLPDLRFTKMCPSVVAGGECAQEDCTYAHSPHELRTPEAACQGGGPLEPQQEPQRLELAETKSTGSGSLNEEDEDLSIAMPASAFKRQMTEDPAALCVYGMRVKNTFITIDEDEPLSKDDFEGKPWGKRFRSKSWPPSVRMQGAADPKDAARADHAKGAEPPAPKARQALPRAPGCQASETRRRSVGNADILGFGTADNGLATMLESFASPGQFDQLLGHVPGKCYEEGWWYDGSVNPAHPAGYACAADFGGAGYAPLGWGASRTGEAFPFEAGWGAPALTPGGPVMPAVGAAAPRIQYSAPPAPSLRLLSGNRLRGQASSWGSSGA